MDEKYLTEISNENLISAEEKLQTLSISRVAAVFLKLHFERRKYKTNLIAAFCNLFHSSIPSQQNNKSLV